MGPVVGLWRSGPESSDRHTESEVTSLLSGKESRSLDIEGSGVWARVSLGKEPMTSTSLAQPLGSSFWDRAAIRSFRG